MKRQFYIRAVFFTGLLAGGVWLAIVAIGNFLERKTGFSESKEALKGLIFMSAQVFILKHRIHKSNSNTLIWKSGYKNSGFINRILIAYLVKWLFHFNVLRCYDVILL